MNVELHLRIVGVLLLALVLVNLVVPSRYGWRQQLARVDLFTRQVFWVHMLFIVLSLVLMGILCVGLPGLLTEPSPLARAVLAGLAVFWGMRLLVQLFVYDSRIWRGRRFETVAHGVFTCVWSYVAGVFLWALWLQS